MPTYIDDKLSAIAAQLMNGTSVDIDGNPYTIRKVGRGRLRSVRFQLNGREIDAIEQNPEKPSRWGKLAREKHQVVQYRDTATRKYLAVSVDGKIIEYGR